MPPAAGWICRTTCRRWPLPPDMRHNIFLIVKEALTNALKHAGAREVQVQVKISGHTLEILVQDDGRGFDPASLAEGRRNGVGNMRRRAEAIGGKLELAKRPRPGNDGETFSEFAEDQQPQERLERGLFCRMFMQLSGRRT